MFWIQSLWHFLFGWPSLAIIIGVISVAIAVLEPAWVAKFIPDLRKTAIAVAIVAFTFTSIAGKYYNDGLTEKKRQWDEAISREVASGEQARADAVKSVGPVPANRSVFNNDRRNRDHGKQSGSK